MSDVAVKIRTRSSDADEIAQLAKELARHGFKPRQEMPQLNLITGDVDDAQLDALRGLDGVEAVEPEPTFQAPPFDPKIPQ